jgi:hypothetical protein
MITMWNQADFLVKQDHTHHVLLTCWDNICRTYWSRWDSNRRPPRQVVRPAKFPGRVNKQKNEREASNGKSTVECGFSWEGSTPCVLCAAAPTEL